MLSQTWRICSLGKHVPQPDNRDSWLWLTFRSSNDLQDKKQSAYQIISQSKSPLELDFTCVHRCTCEHTCHTQTCTLTSIYGSTHSDALSLSLSLCLQAHTTREDTYNIIIQFGCLFSISQTAHQLVSITMYAEAIR